jgi:hypothetical protein
MTLIMQGAALRAACIFLSTKPEGLCRQLKKAADRYTAVYVYSVANEEFLYILFELPRIVLILDNELQVGFNRAQHEAEQRFGVGITGLAVDPDVKGVLFRDLVKFLGIFRRRDLDIKSHVLISPFMQLFVVYANYA